MLYDQYFIDDLKDRADLVRRIFRLVFSVILLFAAGFGALAQEASKAELVSEFGPMPCGHLLAQTDGFAVEIERNSASKALILIHPPMLRPEQAGKYRTLISTSLQNQGLTQERISFYLAEKPSDGGLEIELWKSPAGAELPFSGAVPWPEEAADTSRPFIFGYENETNICPSFVPKAFAKLILDNPGSRAHIVVQSGKDGVVDKFGFAESLIDNLKSYNVPRNRIRLYFTKGRDLTAAEFWFVPARKK